MSLLHLIALLLALHVALSDLHARRVSNRALLVALCAGAIALGTPWTGLPVSAALIGGLLGLAALLPFHLMGWMGAGDVKFFAILGFLLGWQSLLPIWVLASLLAGIHAVAILLARRVGPPAIVSLSHWPPLSTARTWWRQASAARQGRRGAPYAAFLSVGTGVLLLVPGVFDHG